MRQGELVVMEPYARQAAEVRILLNKLMALPVDELLESAGRVAATGMAVVAGRARPLPEAWLAAIAQDQELLAAARTLRDTLLAAQQPPAPAPAAGG